MSRALSSSGRGNMRHGLISLLTVIIIILLATAAVLAVSTSHAIDALSQRQANMTSEGYAAEESAQALLAEIDNELSDAKSSGVTGSALMSHLKDSINSLLVDACAKGVTATSSFEDNVITCTFVTQGGRMLESCIEVDDNATYKVVSWKLTTAPQDEDTGDMLWSGSTGQE